MRAIGFSIGRSKSPAKKPPVTDNISPKTSTKQKPDNLADAWSTCGELSPRSSYKCYYQFFHHKIQFTMRAVILLTLFVVLSAGSVFSQAGKGFKLADKQKWDKARTAFQKDLSHEVYGASAHWGMARVELGEGQGVEKYIRAYHLVEKAGILSEKLTAEKRDELIKAGQLPGNFEKEKNSIEKSILADLKKRRNLSQVDEIMDMMTKDISLALPTDSARKFFDAIRKDAIEKALHNAKDYATLYSLSTRHRTIITQNRFLFSSNLDWRLVNAFLSDKNRGAKNLAQFVAENPEHYVSKDCWLEQCLAVIGNDSPEGMLDFLAEYPHSNLYEIVVIRINGLKIREPLVKDLPERQQQIWQNIKLDRELSQPIISSAPLDSSFHRKALVYMERTAPNNRTYYLMEKIIQRYLEDRQWDFATEMAMKCQAYFAGIPSSIPGLPKGCRYMGTRKDWFEAAIPILQQPADNTALHPLDAVNTVKGDEFSPVLSPDGKTLYFAGAGRLDNINGEDVFVTHMINGRWTKPTLVENLSGEANFVPLSLSSDASEMLVFENRLLRLSKRTENGWSAPAEIPGWRDGDFPWIGRAVFGDTGQVIIFSASKVLREIDQASDTDIFVMLRDEADKWGEPFPISPLINTPEQERSPFLHADGKTLYFSSNGHKGLGGMDVYQSKRLDDTWTNWSPPVNMGKEINKLENDWCYLAANTSGTHAFMAYTRTYGGAHDIIYREIPRHVRPTPYLPVTGKIKTEGNRPMLVIARDASGRVVGRGMTKPDGTIDMVIPADIEGEISLESGDSTVVLPDNSIAIKPGEEAIVIREPLQVLPAGEFQLPVILFAKNSSDLEGDAMTKLRAFYHQIKDKGFVLNISGYTDPDGDTSHNEQLSKKRADAVKRQLITLGYPERLLRTAGYGSKGGPQANASEDEKAKYRRVDVKIVHKTE
jgi:outer membrane protein OmpA-like peptidoglycan-associated protein